MISKNSGLQYTSEEFNILNKLFKKYNWILYNNICYPNQLIFKYNINNEVKQSNKVDWYIYIVKEENRVFISIPLKTLGYNMKIYCGDYSENKSIYDTTYSILEEKLQYLSGL